MTPLFGNDFALRLDTFIGYKSKPSSLYQHAFVFDLYPLSLLSVFFSYTGDEHVDLTRITGDASFTKTVFSVHSDPHLTFVPMPAQLSQRTVKKITLSPSLGKNPSTQGTSNA
jgi:hypothetical protein